MQNYWVKRIDVWSVVRTVFPLAWIAILILFFLGYMVVGSVVLTLAREFTGYQPDVQEVGVIVGLMLSIILGFIGTLFLSFAAAVVSVCYNILASLGGGISVQISGDETTPLPAESGEE